MTIISKYSKTFNMPYIRVDSIGHFSIDKTFDCGQCFRFEKISTMHKVAYEGVAFGKYIIVAQDDEYSLYIYNSTIEDFNNIWKNYLSIEEDYSKVNEVILKAFSKDTNEYTYINDAINYSDGIRILKQEPWEALCSFIISQNNNIPRIKKIVNSLSKKCGSKISITGKEKYSFPSAENVLKLGEEGLLELRVGFRAKYIIDAAAKWVKKEIDPEWIFNNSFENSNTKLQTIVGVGPKVAACTLLFGFSKLEAFPIDVWVKRVINNHFPNGLNPNVFGDFGGIAQQYMFYYERYLELTKKNTSQS